MVDCGESLDLTDEALRVLGGTAPFLGPRLCQTCALLPDDELRANETQEPIASGAAER